MNETDALVWLAGLAASQAHDELAAPIRRALDALSVEAVAVAVALQRVLGPVLVFDHEVAFVHRHGAPLRVCARSAGCDYTAWLDRETGEIRVYREAGGRYDVAAIADDGTVTWEPVAPAGDPAAN